jgi:uncharacterized RDD family membrane protein YckC
MTQQPSIYAGRAERFLAFLIDRILVAFATSIPVALVGNEAFVAAAVFLTGLVYSTYFTASKWQATPGKRLLSIYVARTDRRALTTRDAFERFLAYSLPVLPFYASFIPENIAQLMVFWLTLFWFVPILYTEERVGFHDKLCNTRVMVGKVGA